MAHTADMHTQAQLYPTRHICHKGQLSLQSCKQIRTTDETSDFSPI